LRKYKVIHHTIAEKTTQKSHPCQYQIDQAGKMIIAATKTSNLASAPIACRRSSEVVAVVDTSAI
jgi:hypothetical protein